MPDAATWVLTLGAPSLAAGVALWVNRARMLHDERAAHRDVVRALLEEGAVIMTTATHGPAFRPPPDDVAGDAQRTHDFELSDLMAPVQSMHVFYAKLLLWFDPNHAVARAWTEASYKASDVATVIVCARGGEIRWVNDDGSPMKRESPEDFQTAYIALQEAAKSWFGASRRCLSDL